MDKIRYAVFLDIDGTLVWGKPTTSENNARALRRAREQGHLICINSGRSRGISRKTFWSRSISTAS